MSQSPMQRSTRKSLTAFARTPSRLAHSTSVQDLASASKSSGSAKPRRSHRALAIEADEDSDDNEELPSNSSTARSSTMPHSSSDIHLTPRNNGLITPARSLGAALGTSNGYGTDESSTPRRTPIYYSPQALSTPPAGLSKSASIPFDMAASARSARRRTEQMRDAAVGQEGEGSVGSGSGSGSSRDSGAGKKKRFVRRRSIWQRVQDYPETILDTILLLTPTSIDDLLPPERYAHPIALGIHSIHFLLTAPLFGASRDEGTSILRPSKGREGVGGRWGQWEDEQRRTGFGATWGVVVFTLILVALSAANAVHLFSKFRTYDMQLRSAAEPPASPHASPIKAPTSSGDDPFADPADTPASRIEQSLALKSLRVSWRVAVFLAKSIFAAVSSMLGRPSVTAPQTGASRDTIQSLKVWDPPEFCLAFFCAYPPTAPLLTHLITPSHPLLSPLTHLVSAMLLSYLAQSFNQLIKDRMILSAEVMREYDRRFVYRRIFASRVDRSVQTEQAESVW